MVSHLASILNNSGVLVADPSEEHEAVRNREGPLLGEQGNGQCLGHAQAKFVRRMPQSFGMQAWWARAVSIWKMLSVICLVVTCRWVEREQEMECCRRLKDLAITLAQRRSCTARPQYRTSEELLVRCKRSWNRFLVRHDPRCVENHRNLVQIPSS